MTKAPTTDSNPGLAPSSTSDFVDTLRSLETTMKQHMVALMDRRNRDASPAAETAGGRGGGGDGRLNSDKKPGLTKSISRLRRDVTKMNSNASSTPTRKEKVTISVRTVFLKVGEIDTLRDRFAADAYVQAKWREPAMDGQLRLQSQEINWDIYWNPRLFIDNVFGDPKESVWHSVSFDSHGQATVCEKRRVNGTFLEYMELNQFPFDTQDLTVSLTTEREDTEVEFVEDTRERCALNVQSFVDEQEWKLHKYIHTWTRAREEVFRATKNKHPVFSAACKASRRPEFFIWNILVVMFLICSLSFATFAVPVNIPQNRLQLSFILLLTTVSFKFVVNQSLPMISYLTYLDKYILGSMGILCCICVWHAVANVIYTNHTTTTASATNATTDHIDPLVQTADYVALGILATIYLGFNFLFLIAITCVARENLRYREEPMQSQSQSFESGSQIGVRELNGAYEENGTIPEVTLDGADSREARANNAAEHIASQQAAISAWQ